MSKLEFHSEGDTVLIHKVGDFTSKQWSHIEMFVKEQYDRFILDEVKNGADSQD